MTELSYKIKISVCLEISALSDYFYKDQAMALVLWVKVLLPFVH